MGNSADGSLREALPMDIEMSLRLLQHEMLVPPHDKLEGGGVSLNYPREKHTRTVRYTVIVQ